MKLKFKKLTVSLFAFMGFAGIMTATATACASGGSDNSEQQAGQQAGGNNNGQQTGGNNNGQQAAGNNNQQFQTDSNGNTNAPVSEQQKQTNQIKADAYFNDFNAQTKVIADLKLPATKDAQQTALDNDKDANHEQVKKASDLFDTFFNKVNLAGSTTITNDDKQILPFVDTKKVADYIKAANQPNSPQDIEIVVNSLFTGLLNTYTNTIYLTLLKQLNSKFFLKTDDFNNAFGTYIPSMKNLPRTWNGWQEVGVVFVDNSAAAFVKNKIVVMINEF